MNRFRRKLLVALSTVAAAAVGAALLLVPATPAAASGPVSRIGTYSASGRCLDGYWGDGTVYWWDCNGTPWQNWEFIYHPDGTQSIRNTSTNLCLALDAQIVGARLLATPCNFYAQQLFYGDPYYVEEVYYGFSLRSVVKTWLAHGPGDPLIVTSWGTGNGEFLYFHSGTPQIFYND